MSIARELNGLTTAADIIRCRENDALPSFTDLTSSNELILLRLANGFTVLTGATS